MEENNFEEILNPEIIEEKKEYLPTPVEEVKPEIKKGKLSIRYRTIAEYAARGYSIEIIAQTVGLKRETVYHILESNERVWEEMNSILKNVFAEGDRVLANIYLKALYKLDARLNHPNTESDAIDKIMKAYGTRTSGGEKPSIVQFFQNTGGQGPIVEEGIDQLIMKKRKERGLDSPTVPKSEETDELPD
jgi:plasmid maintenance system antidote protein VapI